MTRLDKLGAASNTAFFLAGFFFASRLWIVALLCCLVATVFVLKVVASTPDYD